ncbi:MAG: GatB/YqeY domain-containing protein, partial [Acidimicrobiia bacterium]
IQEQLAAELRDAMKSRDRRRMDVIRQVETEMSRAKSEPGFQGELDDGLYRRVIAAYVKKMDKARREYEELGDRGRHQAEKLAFETDYLQRWLPEALGEDETRELVRQAIAELGVQDPKMVGRVVGHLMKSGREGLDGSLVNRLVREELDSA